MRKPQCFTTGGRFRPPRIKAFSETNFTEDLKAISIPVLILHGEDDQIVPIADLLAFFKA
jgi:pimeloyl-ACP methyl ester carboxylesterase